jgi:hypothetical protein
MTPQPNQTLTAEDVQRRIYQGICDQRLREWYETEAGLDYLMARLNLARMTVVTPAPDAPATT